MDFDEYDYLEKTVEDGGDDRDGSVSKKTKTNDGGTEKTDRSYRKREDDQNGDGVDADAEDDVGRRHRRSRGIADDELESGSGGRKRERGGDGWERSSRDNDRDRRVKERERRDKVVEKGSRDSEKDLLETRVKDRESSRGLDREKDRDRERERESRVKDRGERESREKTREKDRDGEKEKSGKDREVKEKYHDSGRERDRKREFKEMDGGDRERGSREREREKEKERSRDRDRDRERARRDRVKEKEESSRRSRSRSMSRRHEIDIDRDREIHDREREFEPRRPREKKEAMEPEVDPERDQRTVFAYQMPLKANERDVYEFFTKAGKVRDVRLIMDRNSRRSKGVGYIEFYDAMSVPMAIALSGHLLHGQPVMVKPSEAEKNLVQSTASAGGASGVTGPYGPVDRKLYVGNLHFNMTELQLRQIFEPFGAVELVQLPLDLETGHCKGFGFVQFAMVEHAKAAQSLNGTLEIAGRVIKVSSVADHVGVQETGAKTADFDDDDDDGGGLSLNAHSRALLMQKLDRTGVASSITGSLGYPMLNGAAPTQQTMLPVNGHSMVPGSAIPGQAFAPLSSEPVGNPSECLLLKNMFDPATVTDPDFDLDIKEEVEDECSNFGRVKHIHVEKHSAGFVNLRFETVEAAQKVQRAMHHRWYAGRLISALFMQPYEYEAKFKGES